MTTRSALLLDAAISVLGTGGSRALTHRAVDSAAGLPPGSCSNYFRSREALIEGVVRRLEETDVEQWTALTPAFQPASVQEFASLLSTTVLHAVTTDRARSQARYAVLVEAMIAGAESTTLESIRRNRGHLIAYCESILGDLGASEPDHATRVLVDYLDGLILHQLTGSLRSPTVLRGDLRAFLTQLLA